MILNQDKHIHLHWIYYPMSSKCLNVSFNPECFRANIILYSSRSKIIPYRSLARMLMTTTKTKSSSFWITWKNVQVLIVPNKLFKKRVVVSLMLYLVSFYPIKYRFTTRNRVQNKCDSTKFQLKENDGMSCWWINLGVRYCLSLPYWNF